MERQLLKAYADVLTAHQEIARLVAEHIEIGYDTTRTSLISFKIKLDDGEITFWWEKGNIYFQ